MEWLLSKGFTRDEFRNRRRRVAQEIGADAYALLQAAPRSAAMQETFPQSKQFFYLSGVEIERSYLLIQGDTGVSTLFVPLDTVGEGHHQAGSFSLEGLPAFAKTAGFEHVLPVSALKETLGEAQASGVAVFTPHQPAEHAMETRPMARHVNRLRSQDEWDLAGSREERFISLIKKRFPETAVKDLSPILDEMRLIKSPDEIEVMKEAARITAALVNECMKATKPGIPARKLPAIGKYVYQLLGNCSQGYDFLVTPSTEGSETLLDGEMVLLDVGPEYLHYTTDIARIWPVNGHYDDWQRHTYGFIVEYHKTLISHLKPGVTPQNVYDDTTAEMLARYKDDAVASAMIHNMMERGVRYLNHTVGMSVHDNVKQWHGDPLREGMVMVVDPMIWLENVPHTYVRVEDTVVITKNGCERLTADCPIELDEVEALMKEPGRFPM